MAKGKRKKKRVMAECSRCGALHRRYLDYSVGEDAKLQLIANLLTGQSGAMELDTSTAIEVGHAIDSYLQLKLVRESVFFGRSLKRCTLPESELKAEFQKARAYRSGI